MNQKLEQKTKHTTKPKVDCLKKINKFDTPLGKSNREKKKKTNDQYQE